MTITSPFTAADGALTWVGDGETVRIEPWGANSIRVRARFMQPIADATGLCCRRPPTPRTDHRHRR